MKYLWLIVAALTTMLGQATPAMAAPDPNPDYAVSCTANAARWDDEGDNTSSDKTSASAGVDVPPGTSTRIFICAVGGHRVRMNFAEWAPALYHCGATQDGAISVWIDDVKVVDQRSYGDYASCMADDGKGNAVDRIIVNRLMHLTVCTDPGPDAPPAGTTRDAANCVLTDLSAKIGKPKAGVSTVIARTAPALILTTNTDPVCRVLDAKLQGHMLDDTDPVEAAFSLYSGYTGSNDVQHDTYSLDIDNDGVPDRLTYDYEPDPENSMGVFSWQRSGEGPAMTIDDTTTGISEWNGRFIGPIDVVRVGGKTYLYMREGAVANAMPSDDIAGFEAAAGTSRQAFATRHLLKAKSDGTFTKVCEWTPRQRPEEFL